MPRKHVERILVSGNGEDREEREIKLGAWIGNQRSRAGPLPRARGTAFCHRHAMGMTRSITGALLGLS
ncbi:hypothetical protein HDC93_007040 [Streptomyces sp. AK010]|nr:hypothetical protein [Streptomyces sp. AK010]